MGVVPAAGHGTRLCLATGSKEMLPVGGRPVMDVLVARMRAGGAAEIRVVTRPDKRDVIDHAEARGLRVILGRPLTAPASMAIGLAGLASPDLALIGYPDCLWTPADGYRRLVAALRERPGVDVALGLFSTPDAARSDVVVVDGDGLVRDIVVKSPSPPSDVIYGCVAARPAALAGLADVEGLSALLLQLCARGRVLGVPLLGFWLDIGTPASLARARELPADWDGDEPPRAGRSSGPGPDAHSFGSSPSPRTGG